MRFNGRASAMAPRRSPTVAVGSDRRNHVDRVRHEPTRPPSSRVSERTMFDPGSVRLHAQDRGRRRGCRLDRHHRDADTEPALGRAKAKGRVGQRSHRWSSSTANGTPNLIAEVRASGARAKLITDGDIFGATVAAGWPDAGVDVLLGTGGTPEGVTAAAVEAARAARSRACWRQRDEAERQAADRPRLRPLRSPYDR